MVLWLVLCINITIEDKLKSTYGKNTTATTYFDEAK